MRFPSRTGGVVFGVINLISVPKTGFKNLIFV